MRHLARIACLVLGVCSGECLAQQTFEREPIAYSRTESNDRVAGLISDLKLQRSTLAKDPRFGYLPDLLERLKIPVSSQTLVFSKTSLQREHINPKTPRAIYFNDDSYVGWVPDGELIEIASVDSQLGTVFYTLPSGNGANGQDSPVLIERRNDRCLFCHASSDAGRVPGLLMQSVYTSDNGNRVFLDDPLPADPSGHLQQRWGGWYVTGTHGHQIHLGNLTVDTSFELNPEVLKHTANWTDLSHQVDVSRYLSPHSDLVALLVLRHQVDVHNLLTKANHQARRTLYLRQLHDEADLKKSLDLGERERRKAERMEESRVIVNQIAERVVEGLLVNAIELVAPVMGTSDFATQFQQSLSETDRLAPLRQLDLSKGLFRYPCSYLIGTDAFAELPAVLVVQIKIRLRDLLENGGEDEKYDHLTATKRGEILRTLERAGIL